MKRLILCLAVLVGFVVVAPGIGAAACLQQDLSGTWMLYVNTTDNDASWVKMKLVINSTGAVAASNTGVSSDPGHNFSLTGGKLTLSTACTGSGKLNISQSGKPPMSVTVTEFAMPGVAPKTVFSGVGKDDKLTPFTFTAIKVQ